MIRRIICLRRSWTSGIWVTMNSKNNHTAETFSKVGRVSIAVVILETAETAISTVVEYEIDEYAREYAGCAT
jgi:hypothetical protein